MIGDPTFPAPIPLKMDQKKEKKKKKLGCLEFLDQHIHYIP